MVEHDEALTLLASGNPRQRLEAARFLRRNAQTGDRIAVARAARHETVSRIRKVLDDTLESLTPPPGSNDEGLAARDTAARAVKETTTKVVHEVRKLLPPLRLAAEQDVGERFNNSRTREYIDRLDSLVDAIDRLGRAASAPVMTDFDLGALVDDAVMTEAGGTGVTVLKHGPTPMLVLGDYGHVLLALSNGLRNAIEASLEADSEDPPSVVVSWDMTDTHYWIAVLDQGVGLPPGSHRAFELGQTSKPKHDGAGLPIAKQAIESMAGEVELRPRDAGGASYEIRWPRPAA